MAALIAIMMAAPMDGGVFCSLGSELGREKGFFFYWLWGPGGTESELAMVARRRRRCSMNSSVNKSL